MPDKPNVINTLDAAPPEEAAQIAEVAELTVKLLDKRYPAPARVLRGVHPKSHGLLRARFKVLPALDTSLRVGLFAVPGRQFDALIRLSNAAVRVEHDLKNGLHGSRGMAIKVLDVGAKVLLKDGDAQNQDFLMINQPAFAFANVRDYLRLTHILDQFDDELKPFFDPSACPMAGMSAATIQRTGELVQELTTKIPCANPLEVQYFSAAPFMFGRNRVVKFSARPKGPLVKQEVPANSSENYLRDAVVATVSKNQEIELDFLVQVRSAEAPGLDIDNASTEWDETTTPFQRVATIEIPSPQPRISSDEREERDERLVFTPWHSLPEHQPIGGINRLRKEVYLASAGHRQKPRKG